MGQGYCKKDWKHPGDCEFDPPPERTFTSAELTLERAAIVREAAGHTPMYIKAGPDDPGWLIEKGACSCGGLVADGVTPWNKLWSDHILAISTDQPALDRHDAERDAKITELSDALQMAMDDLERIVAERVQQAKLEEAEWWFTRVAMAAMGADPQAECRERIMPLRAAASPVSQQAGAPEEP